MKFTHKSIKKMWITAIIVVINISLVFNQCTIFSEDIDINSFTSFVQYNKSIIYTPISDQSACNRSLSCTISNNTEITLCLSPKDFLTLVKKMDFSNLTVSEQALIRDFLIKLELLTLDNEDQAFFSTLCKTLLKRVFNKQSDFSFLVACNFLERFQKPDSLYRKLRKQNISLAYNESNYIGNYMTEVGRARMERNLTGKVIDFRALKEALDIQYNETNQTDSLLRRGFESFVINPYLGAFNIERKTYNSHFTLIKAISKSKPGVFQYALNHAWNNASLYYQLNTPAIQKYSTGVKYFYNRLKYKLNKITFVDRKGTVSQIMRGFTKIVGDISIKGHDAYQRATVDDPYGSYIVLNDTEFDTSEEDVNCTSIYWWLNVDYWDPKLSPFFGFVNGSSIDLVFYFLVIPYPPPRTCITIIDWYINWIRRSWTFTTLAPELSLTPDPENCLPGWPYFVDTRRNYTVGEGNDTIPNKCFYPLFLLLNFSFCELEKTEVESGDLRYCKDWGALDEVFLGWVQFLSTTFLSPMICRVRVLQVFFGWMVYKKDGVFVCEENEYTSHLPPMMGKCLFFKSVYTFIDVFIFCGVTVLILTYLKYLFPEVAKWVRGGRISENFEGADAIEGDLDKMRDKIEVLELEIDPLKPVAGKPVFIKTTGKAVNNSMLN